MHTLFKNLILLCVEGSGLFGAEETVVFQRMVMLSFVIGSYL